MSKFVQLLTSLREQMGGNLSRTDALKPLSTLIGLLLTSLVVSAGARSSPAVVWTLTVATSLAVATYLAAYIFCLINDRDALRNERYFLRKLESEPTYRQDERAAPSNAPTGLETRG